MRICITGGTGFVGRALARHLTAAGHQVWLVSRRPPAAGDPFPVVQGDPTQPGPWQLQVAGADGVINLAGRSIFCRWTAANKAAIRTSRIATTRNVAEAMAGGPPGRVLVSASAVGYYGDGGDQPLPESAPPGNDFLGRLAVAWEEAAAKAATGGVRVVRCRLGVVLGKGGGALHQMLPAFRLGLGAPLGSGRQWFPWIHLDDLCRVIRWCLETTDLTGPVNCVAPQAVTNGDFSRALARALGRPCFLPGIPAWLLRLVLGEMASVVCNSQRVVPAVLQERGFSWRFPELAPALADLV